jgi:hypothetical protein
MKSRIFCNSFFALLILTIIASCSRKTETENPESLKIQILGKSYEVPYIWKTDLHEAGNATGRVSSANITSAKVILTSTQIASSFGDLKNQTTGLSGISTGNLLSVLYYSESAFDNIQLSNIRAVGVMINEGSKMRYRHFSRNPSTNSFSEIPGLNIAIDNYTNLDFELLLQEVASPNAQVASYLFATTEVEIKKGPQKASEATYLSKALIEMDLPLPDDAKCAKPCERSPGACNKSGSGDDIKYSCDECVKGQMRTFASDNSISFNPEELSDAFAYKFRDSFLVNYAVGRKYFQYYYKLSYVVRAYRPFTAGNFLQNLTFAKNIYLLANRLQFGQNTDIIVTSAFKSEATTMIDYYKTLSNNTEYNQILNSIKQDLILYENKPRSQVIALMSL